MADDAPGDALVIILSFDRPGVHRAFAAWLASGQCYEELWAWMGRHGYQA